MTARFAARVRFAVAPRFARLALCAASIEARHVRSVLSHVRCCHSAIAANSSLRRQCARIARPSAATPGQEGPVASAAAAHLVAAGRGAPSPELKDGSSWPRRSELDGVRGQSWRQSQSCEGCEASGPSRASSAGNELEMNCRSDGTGP